MKLKETLEQLESLGQESMRKQNCRQGFDGEQFGVRLGDIRKVAKQIKFNRELAMQLWDTAILDARMLAILLLKPKDLNVTEMDQMVRSMNFTRIADWFNAYLLRKHPEKETMRLQWMQANNPMASRSGWDLTAECVDKQPEGLDLVGLLNRIETEMGEAAPEPQWTMNLALVEIGIHHPEHRERALAIGEALGVYSDYPAAKGCTPPFAPIWINEMVKRMG